MSSEKSQTPGRPSTVTYVRTSSCGRRRAPAAAAGRAAAGSTSRNGTIPSHASPSKVSTARSGGSSRASSSSPTAPVGEEDVLPRLRLRPRLVGQRPRAACDVVERVRLPRGVGEEPWAAHGLDCPPSVPPAAPRPGSFGARRPARRPCGRTGTEPAQTRGRRNGTIGFEGGGTAPHPGRGWRRWRSLRRGRQRVLRPAPGERRRARAVPLSPRRPAARPPRPPRPPPRRPCGAAAPP